MIGCTHTLQNGVPGDEEGQFPSVPVAPHLLHLVIEEGSLVLKLFWTTWTPATCTCMAHILASYPNQWTQGHAPLHVVLSSTHQCSSARTCSRWLPAPLSERRRSGSTAGSHHPVWTCRALHQRWAVHTNTCTHTLSLSHTHAHTHTHTPLLMDTLCRYKIAWEWCSWNTPWLEIATKQPQQHNKPSMKQSNNAYII